MLFPFSWSSTSHDLSKWAHARPGVTNHKPSQTWNKCNRAAPAMMFTAKTSVPTLGHQPSTDVVRCWYHFWWSKLKTLDFWIASMSTCSCDFCRVLLDNLTPSRVVRVWANSLEVGRLCYSKQWRPTVLSLMSNNLKSAFENTSWVKPLNQKQDVDQRLDLQAHWSFWINHAGWSACLHSSYHPGSCLPQVLFITCPLCFFSGPSLRTGNDAHDMSQKRGTTNITHDWTLETLSKFQLDYRFLTSSNYIMCFCVFSGHSRGHWGLSFGGVNDCQCTSTLLPIVSVYAFGRTVWLSTLHRPTIWKSMVTHGLCCKKNTFKQRNNYFSRECFVFTVLLKVTDC